MGTLFKKSNGIFYVVELRDGKRSWRSTGATSRSEVKKFPNRAPVVPALPTPAATTLAQFAEVLLLYAETNLAPATVKLSRAAIKTFTRSRTVPWRLPPTKPA
jgi:hypothetical protein